MNSTSAVSALPNEILAAIFEVEHSSHDSAETKVSAVSRHWRGVAIGTPRLWTRIRRAPFQQQLEPIALYLCRSKAVPIDLRIKMSSGGEDPRDDIEPLYQLLSAHFGRCYRLCVLSSSLRNLDMLLHFLHSVSALYLRSIYISCVYHGDKREVTTPTYIFTGGAPVPDSICLDSIELQSCLPPLGSVTAIYLNGISFYPWMPPKEWVKMISTAQSLLHLEIDGDTVVEDWDVSSVTFEMPVLQTLSLNALGEQPATFHSFLEWITAPHLEVLMLKNFAFYEVKRFICPNQFPSLHTLILWSIGSGVEVIEYVMAALPDIRHLVCTVDCGDYWPLINLLGSDPTYLPNLQTVALPAKQHDLPIDDIRDTLLIQRMCMSQHIQKIFVSPTHLAEARAELTDKFGIVEVEEWRAELVPGWPAWSDFL